MRCGRIHEFRLWTGTRMYSLGMHLGYTVPQGFPPLPHSPPLGREEGVLVEILSGMQECRNAGVAA